MAICITVLVILGISAAEPYVFFSPGNNPTGAVVRELAGAKSNVNSGVPTFIDASHAIAHNKITILDGRKVIKGSFNFTKDAEEKNAENLIVLEDPAVGRTYTTNWQTYAGHSERCGWQQISK